METIINELRSMVKRLNAVRDTINSLHSDPAVNDLKTFRSLAYDIVQTAEYLSKSTPSYTPPDDERRLYNHAVRALEHPTTNKELRRRLIPIFLGPNVSIFDRPEHRAKRVVFRNVAQRFVICLLDLSCGGPKHFRVLDGR